MEIEGDASVFNHVFTPLPGSDWPSETLRMDGVSVIAFHPQASDPTRIRMYDYGTVVVGGRTVNVHLTMNMAQGQDPVFDVTAFEQAPGSARTDLFSGRCSEPVQ